MATALPDRAVPATTGAAGRRARRRWWRVSVVAPAAFLIVLVLVAGIGPFVLPDPELTALREARRGVGTPGHLLGTDGLGRDIFSRLASGARISIVVGAGAVASAMVVGTLLGLAAGYVGRWVDAFLMRCVDVLLAFPALVLALAIAAYLGPSIPSVIVALGVAGIPAYARLARAAVLPLKGAEFVTAARMSGAGDVYIVTRHLLPIVLRTLSAYGLLAVGVAVLGEAALSFLGLGVRPPDPSWGTMIEEGRGDIERAPHIVLVPGTALFLTVLSLNLLADALAPGGGARGRQ